MKKRVISGVIVFLAIFMTALVTVPQASALTPGPTPTPTPTTPWSWSSTEGTFYFVGDTGTTITQETTGASITITQIVPSSSTTGEPKNFFNGQLMYTDPTAGATTVDFSAFLLDDGCFSFNGVTGASTPLTVRGDFCFVCAPNSVGSHKSWNAQKSLRVRGAVLGTGEIFEGYFTPSD